MRMTSIYTHAKRSALTLMLAGALVACGDDTVEPEQEPDVATMRITVGTQTINVNAKTGAVTGGPLLLTRGTATTVSVQYLRSNGSADPLVTTADFRTDITPSSTAALSFARTGAFTGTLTGIQAGSTSVNVNLFHLGEGHAEFDWDIPVTIQ